LTSRLATPPTQPECLDLFDPELFQNPYPHYAAARARGGMIVPAGRNGDMPGPAWILAHATASALLTDLRIQRQTDPRPTNRSDQTRKDSPFGRMIGNWMLFQDAPAHTRQRASLGRAFTPPVVAAMKTQIERIVHRRLESILRKRSFDLIKDFAFPLPVQVIASLLGLPARDCRHFKRWSTALSDAIDLRPSAQILKAANDAVVELQAYFTICAGARRRNPTNDLLTALLRQSEIEGELTEDEVFATFTLLLTAGHETTTNLIGNGMLALLSNPDQLLLVREEPEHMRSAVEEFLRYDSPVQITSRIVSTNMEVEGHELRAGQRLLIVIGSANRDPVAFINPDRLDVRRTPNPHLTFGMGSHYCAGAPLARMQASIAIGALTSRLPELELIQKSQTWRANASFRGLLRLPCRC